LYEPVSSGVIFVVGLVISLVILETTGIYPGGIIVPGFLALYVPFPGRLVSTFIIALLAALLYKLISTRTLLFGRRRFIFMLITGALLSTCYNLFLAGASVLPLDSRVVGMIIPGLMANNAEKQGIVKTFSAAVAALVLTWLLSGLYLSVWGNW
jgi:poly-gamma-glutamate biosynthesis protein PgsC/CapC